MSFMMLPSVLRTVRFLMRAWAPGSAVWRHFTMHQFRKVCIALTTGPSWRRHRYGVVAGVAWPTSCIVQEGGASNLQVPVVGLHQHDSCQQSTQPHGGYAHPKHSLTSRNERANNRSAWVMAIKFTSAVSRSAMISKDHALTIRATVPVRALVNCRQKPNLWTENFTDTKTMADAKIDEETQIKVHGLGSRIQ